jgi:hypothetical protein
LKNRACPISLAGSHFGDTRHVCAFFRSDDEEYRALLPFVKEGFDHGDRAVHVVSPAQREDHLRRLEAAGIDTTAAAARGQLALRASTDTYLRDGRFDHHRLLGVLERLAGGAVGGVSPRGRIVCRIDWAAESRTFVDDVIEFESRVEELWRDRDDALICTYRLGRFGGDAVIAIVRTHPLVIVGGILQRNPFSVPWERIVPAAGERRATQGVRGLPGG